MSTPPLPDWYRDLDSPRVVAGRPGDISGVVHDSRRVTPGCLFVAIPGQFADGNSFIPDALRLGASHFIVQEDREDLWRPRVTGDATFVAVPDARASLAPAAAGFFGHPARTLGTIGVTGTDGKTTTTHLIAHVLRDSSMPAGHLSSVEFCAGGKAQLNASHMTTLEASDVQRLLADVRNAGDRYAVIEASSIGLHAHRVDCCEFDVGVFTNLTPDHLDYHGTMARYRDAKALLFRMLDVSRDKGVAKAAVLNADDPVSRDMRAATKQPVVSYGLRGDVDLAATDITTEGFGTRFVLRSFGQSVPVRVGLIGEYNAANCLAAVAVAMTQGVNAREAASALESFPGVPGRLELIDEGQPFRVVVDIASTEQAMRNVASILRTLTRGRLIIVFGAAGERDAARRRGIARAVAEHADHAVLTNEDPRGEDGDAIVDEIARALRAADFTRFERELDRREAIRMAFAHAGKNDTVLLAGKGTEQSIVIGTTHWPWDERRVARELLRGDHDV